MNLFKSSFWIGISSVLKMLSGLIVNKIMAYVIGPSGIALVGSFINLNSIISNFANGALGSGVTKYIAEYEDNNEKDKVVAHAVKITLICSTILCCLIVLFSKRLSLLILKSENYQSIFIICGLCTVFYGFNTTFSSILCGYKKLKYIVISGILSNLISIILAIFITIRLGLFGALINTIIAQIFTFIICFFVMQKLNLYKKNVLKIKFDKILIYKLFNYTMMSIVSAITIPLSLIIIRSFVIKYISYSEAGLVQGIWNISNVYISIVIMFLSTYFMPEISSTKNNVDLRKQIIEIYRFVIPISLFGLIVIYLLKQQIVLILYSKEFLSMLDLFVFHLVGDFFRIASLILEYVLVAKAMTKIYITFAITNTVIYTISSFILMKYYGVIGESYAYCIYNLFYFIVLIVVFKNVLFKNQKKETSYEKSSIK